MLDRSDEAAPADDIYATMCSGSPPLHDTLKRSGGIVIYHSPQKVQQPPSA